MATIKLKRGSLANLLNGQLGIGELGYATDTKEIYVGNGIGKTLVGTAYMGLLADRPIPSVPGKLFFDPATGSLYVDTGSAWILVSQPVLTVAGKTGDVILSKSDVGLGNVANTAQVTAVTATAPIVSSGGTTPAISINAATTTLPGSMSAAQVVKLNGIATSATNTPLSSTVPSALGTAAAGNGTSASRYNHVHQMPTAAQVGALASTLALAATGDATAPSTALSTGTLALTLSNTGVAAGVVNNSPSTITSITIDAKGRVTSVGTPAAIAPSFANVTGKPTTLAGYGITDALAASGNAASATKLSTPRYINGVLFDGTADITVNAVDATPRIASSEKGLTVAELVDGIVPTAQLPAMVSSVNGVSGAVSIARSDLGLGATDTPAFASVQVSDPGISSPTVADKGKFRYVEIDGESRLEMVMRTGLNTYAWTSVIFNRW